MLKSSIGKANKAIADIAYDAWKGDWYSDLDGQLVIDIEAYEEALLSGDDEQIGITAAVITNYLNRSNNINNIYKFDYDSGGGYSKKPNAKNLRDEIKTGLELLDQYQKLNSLFPEGD